MFSFISMAFKDLEITYINILHMKCLGFPICQMILLRKISHVSFSRDLKLCSDTKPAIKTQYQTDSHQMMTSDSSGCFLL